MSRLNQGLAIACFLLLVPLSVPAHEPPQAEYVPGEVLVKMKSTLTGVQLTGLLSSVRKSKQLGRHISKLVLAKGTDVKAAIRQLQQNPLVEYAQPNYIKHIQQVIPNDAQFKSQWGLRNTGQTLGPLENTVSGTAGADIKATAAWDITKGDPGVVIAVIDTGVDTTHPDLQGNLVAGWDFINDDDTPLDLNGHGTEIAGIIAAKGNNLSYTSGVMWRASIMPLRVFDANGKGKSSDIIDAINYAIDHGVDIINASFGMLGYDGLEHDAIQAAGSAGITFITAACNNGENNDTSSRPCEPASYNDLGNIIAVAATDQHDHLANFSNYGPSTVDVGAPGVNIVSIRPEFSNVSGWPKSLVSIQGAPTQAVQVDLSGQEACRLWVDPQFISGDNTVTVDGINAEVSVDSGQSWQGVSNDPVSTNGKIDLSAYDGLSAVMIRITPYAGNSSSPDTISFNNNVFVDCYSGNHSQAGLTYLDGTSVSAAYVSGVAGLIYAKFGPMTPNALYNRIINSVDPVPSLAGMVVSGGRVNASAAVGGEPGPTGGTGSGGGGGGGLSLLTCLLSLLRLVVGLMTGDNRARD